MKNNYYYYLLNILINKYEKRFFNYALNIRKITIKFNEKELKDYVSDGSYKYRSSIENAVEELVNQNIIKVIYERGKVIDYIFLNIDQIDKAYEELNKENIIITWQNYLNAINNGTSKLSKSIFYKINSIYNNHQGIKTYLNDYKIIETIIHCIDELENNQIDILLRDFSVKVFDDSKYLENNLSTIRKYYRLVGIDNDDDNETFLKKRHIYKNPISIIIKGNALIKVNQQVIDLSAYNSPLHLYKEGIENITFLNISNNIVTTIENKTTFFDYHEDGLIVFLEGFPNSMAINLLKKINSNLSSIKFNHFGDIDLGGFKIFNYLCEQTNILFNTIHMDIDTLKKYKNKLTRVKDKSYYQELNSLKYLKYVARYSDVIDYMIENEVILEEEILYAQ